MRFPIFLLVMGTPVRVLLIILVVTLLIISVSGIVMAATSPNMIEEQTSLLSYEHNGSFDYTIYLKPSYLFGSSSDELITSYQYPANLVDTINFAFTYNAANEGEADIWINAILRSQDVWSKEIELVSKTKTTGLSTLNFSLNLTEINEIYNTLQEETGIDTITRTVNIEAHIETGDNHFAHNLPITLSNLIVEIGSNLTSSLSTGTTEFSYAVNLKPNSVFDSSALASPPSSATTTLGPGEVIFSNLADRMLLDYNYRFRANGQVEQLNVSLAVVSILEVPDVWKKEFLLLQQNGNGNLNISTIVDLARYFQSVSDIRSETGVPIESYNLNIVANILVTATTPFGDINDMFKQSMTGTISSGILTWETPLTATEEGDILSTQTVSNPKTIFGFSISGARVLFPITAVVSFILISLLIIPYFIPLGAGLSDIEQELLRISRKYGSRIVEATSQKHAPGERVISIDSIDSLVDTADELGKLVIYKPPTKRSESHSYYVFDGSTRYQYILGDKQVEQEDDSIQIELPS